MEKWLPRVALGLGLAAIVGLFVQQSTISDLERRLADVSTAGAATAESPGPSAATSSAAVGYDDGRLKARVAALEKRIAKQETLRRAVARAVAEKRVKPSTRTPSGDGNGGEVHALREDVDALLTGAGVQSPEGKQEVASLVEKIRARERAARRKRWSEFRRKSDAAFIKTFAEKHNLDEDQSVQVTEIMQRMRKKQMALWRGLRDGSLQYEEIASRRKALNATLTVELGQVLDATQVTAFQKQLKERRRRGVF